MRRPAPGRPHERHQRYWWHLRGRPKLDRRPSHGSFALAHDVYESRRLCHAAAAAARGRRGQRGRRGHRGWRVVCPCSRHGQQRCPPRSPSPATSPRLCATPCRGVNDPTASSAPANRTHAPAAAAVPGSDAASLADTPTNRVANANAADPLAPAADAAAGAIDPIAIAIAAAANAAAGPAVADSCAPTVAAGPARATASGSAAAAFVATVTAAAEPSSTARDPTATENAAARSVAPRVAAAAPCCAAAASSATVTSCSSHPTASATSAAIHDAKRAAAAVFPVPTPSSGSAYLPGNFAHPTSANVPRSGSRHATS